MLDSTFDPQKSLATFRTQGHNIAHDWTNSGSEPAAGRTLLLFTCPGHVLLGIILVLSERRLWASAIAEALLPAVIAVVLLV
ncbi:hypothetical protein BJQ90_02628 [Arthrobacter sp. SO3]|nr:hypothetical protein [Arthrobacter sp. SO3]